MDDKRRDSTGKALTVATALLLLLGWLIYMAWEREERNYALTEAVGRNDVARVRQLLDAGANPNARWSGYELRDRLDRLLHRDQADWDEKYRILNFTRHPEIVRLLIAHGGKP